jgi:hypothetical protein
MDGGCNECNWGYELPKLAENPMCLHVFAKKNRRSQKLSRPPSYAQFIPLVTQAMFGEN